MARKPRVHFPGAFYHVMLRGNNKKQIFFSEEDRKYFYFLVQDGIEKYKYYMHGFCLMSNHVHLVIQVGEIPVSKIMHNLSFRFTNYINRRQGSVGHLFQGRFKAILVDEDNYLLTLIRYIHLNPVRAKIVENAKDYSWSSHRAYLGLENIPWLTKDFLLSYFNKSKSAAIFQYNCFMHEIVENQSTIEFQSGNQRNFSILANDDFIEKLEKKIHIEKVHISMDDLIKTVCSYYLVEVYQLQSHSRKREFSRIRGVIAWLAQELKISNLHEVAKYFNRDASGLSRLLRVTKISVDQEAELNKLCQLLK